jgi:VanZ family protein
VRATASCLPVRLFCLLAFVAATLKLLTTGDPASEASWLAAVWDKLLHFTFFAGLAVLAWLAAAGRSSGMVWVLVMIVGALDETRQAFLPTRSADMLDLVANGMGAAVALATLQTFSKDPSRSEPCAES